MSLWLDALLGSFNWMSFCSHSHRHHLDAYGKVFKQGLLENFSHNVNLSVGISFFLHSSKLQKWNSRNMERNILNTWMTNAQLGLGHYKFTCSKKLGLDILHLTRSFWRNNHLTKCFANKALACNLEFKMLNANHVKENL